MAEPAKLSHLGFGRLMHSRRWLLARGALGPVEMDTNVRNSAHRHDRLGPNEQIWKWWARLESNQRPADYESRAATLKEGFLNTDDRV